MTWNLLASAAANGGGGGATTGNVDSSGADFCGVGVGWYTGGGSLGTGLDSKGNTYTLLTRTAGNVAFCQMAYVQAPTVGASHNWTCAVGYPGIAGGAFSGSVATPFDAENGNSGIAVTSLGTNSITLAESNELTLAAVGVDNTLSPNAFTAAVLSLVGRAGSDATGDGVGFFWGVDVTSDTLSWTNSAAGGVAVRIASFKGAAAAAAKADTRSLMGV